jgi:2-alkyl-3-oxoalkanoate reductase
MPAVTTILVTGASGFVGGAFLRRFRERADLELHGASRRPSALPNYHQLDLSRPFDLRLRPDVVIHAAALASPWGKRSAYQRHNVDATAEVVRFCERNGQPRLVYVSSSSVFYRDEHQLGIREDSPIGPAFVNDYAATKFGGEQVVRGYRGSFVIVRPRAVFGPGDTVLFPRVLRAAAKGRLPMLVTDGEKARGDLVYIDVLCDQLLHAATAKLRHDAYNLTNAEPVVLQDLLLDVLARLGLPAPRRQVRVATAMRAAGIAERMWRWLHLPGEPPLTRFGVSVFAWSKTFDPARLLAEFGRPAVSIGEGIERFVAWQRTQRP